MRVGIVKHIVKRLGHTEPFDERKLFASVFASCVAVREPVGSAELIADKVCQDVTHWLGDRAEVTSKDILHQASKHLDAYNPDAAWIYKHHRVVS